MKSQITYWKETDGKFLGYLNDYPDHWTQGNDLEDLKAHLRDLYHETRFWHGRSSVISRKVEWVDSRPSRKREALLR